MKHHLTAAFLLLSVFLGIKNGYLALLQSGTGEAVTIYPMQTVMLPKQDQLSLAEGIPIHSQSQLNQLLEDYLS